MRPFKWMCVCFVVFTMLTQATPQRAVAGHRMGDSLAFAQLADALEKYLNGFDGLGSGTTRSCYLTFPLAFDANQQFTGLIWSGEDEVQKRQLTDAMLAFDRETRQLSGQPIFADTSRSYRFTSYWDNELSRYWFTKLESRPNGETTVHRYERDEAYATPPNGFKAFIDSMGDYLRNYPGVERLFDKDELILSFILGKEKGVPISIQVNGESHPDISKAVVDQGEWLPAMYGEKPVSTKLEIGFFAGLLTKEIVSSFWPFTHHKSVMLFFPDMPKGDDLQTYSCRPQYEENSNQLVVSFLLNKCDTTVYGPIVLHGDVDEGYRLLDLLQHHLVDSPIMHKVHAGPTRLYFTLLPTR